ncbi:MAG: 4'-phosphopantetheinyl transferase superfamily protein, partial [Desulfobacterales bacterium]
HKSEVVGADVAGKRIGIDIEKFRPCSPGLFRKTAEEEEWALSDDDPLQLFFRYWTAKESVLKASGTGVKDLLKCRVIDLVDATHLAIEYQNEIWAIAHLFFNNHIASVTQHQFSVEWTVEGVLGKDKRRTDEHRTSNAQHRMLNGEE